MCTYIGIGNFYSNGDHASVSDTGFPSGNGARTVSLTNRKG